MSRCLGKIISCCILALLIAQTALAQPKQPATKAIDTSRGDKMIAAYFAAETAKLADASLADIKTLDDWNANREKYRAQLFDMLGLAKLPPRTDLKPVITGKVEHDEFTVENLHFQSSPGLYVTGNLYIPKNLDPDKPAPTILYVCGHGGVKKNGISYGNKTYYTHHGSWFARHGYVCLTIDSLQLGEIEGIHHGTYRYGMWWWLNRGYTPAGVEAWNCIRALDYLETRKEVDKTRFGVTGRSGGGAYSWWIAAIDDRIKVAVPGAGITDLTNHVVDGVVEGHCDCMFMHNTHRWDYAQVAALVAPRPLLISNTDKDTIFPLDGVVRLHEKVARIYKLHGAEKNLGLNIVEGPHKDSQELQLGAFIWFDRFLKKDERVIEKAAVKMLEPEQLRVFEKLPAESVNAEIHETFVPTAGKIEMPADEAAFEKQREVWMKALRAEVFAGWPSESEAVDLELKHIRTELLVDGEFAGLQVNDFTFVSQKGVLLDLRVWHGGNAKRNLGNLVLHVLDESQWNDQGDIPDVAMRKAMLTSNDSIAFFCPRGVGETAFDQSAKKQVQIRRRFMLLGQSLDGMQVWDIRRAVQALRDSAWLKGASISIQSERVMAGNALYASLFEDKIARLDLWHLPVTHREGPIYMNISKHLDMPQAVALAAARTPIRLYQENQEGWDYAKAVGAMLNWNDRQLQIRAVPQVEKK